MSEEIHKNPLSDQGMVAEALKNPERFADIMHAYKSRLSRYINRITFVSPDELDHILQDIFVKVYQNLNDYDSGLAFSSWIYRIAHNETIDHIRRAKHRTESLDATYKDDSLIYENIADETDIEATLDTDYTKKHIAKILDELNPDYKTILILRFLEEKDYNEISDILKKPIGTVSTLIHRAKKQFREKAKELNIRIQDI